MDSVVHFEMPYEDKERMAKFYESTFGWQMQMTGEEMGNYVVATTTETNQTGRPSNPGAINGGFYEMGPDMPKCPSVVIAVDDISASIGMVKVAGGEVIGEPMEIPGIGKYVSFIDTEGNRISMLQALPRG